MKWMSCRLANKHPDDQHKFGLAISSVSRHLNRYPYTQFLILCNENSTHPTCSIRSRLYITWMANLQFLHFYLFWSRPRKWSKFASQFLRTPTFKNFVSAHSGHLCLKLSKNFKGIFFPSKVMKLVSIELRYFSQLCHILSNTN